MLINAKAPHVLLAWMMEQSRYDREPDVAHIVRQVNQQSQPGGALHYWEAGFRGLSHTGEAQHN